MTYAQLVTSGMINGALYALLALGIVLIYRTTRVLNLGHGAIATLSTYVYWQLTNSPALPLVLAWVVTLAFAAGLGVAIDRLAIRRLADAAMLPKIIATLGILLFVVALISVVWGQQTKRIESGFPRSTFRVLGLHISWEQLATFVITLALAGALFWLVRYTRLGVQIRATSYSTPLSQLMGVRVGLVTATAWAAASALAAVAGLLLTPFAFLEPLTLTLFLTKALAAALFGRLESLPMTFLGGVVIGVGEALVPLWFTMPGATDTFNLIVIVGLLLLRAPEMLQRDVQAATV